MDQMLNTPEAAAVVGFFTGLGVLGIILGILSAIVLILSIVAKWKIFSKAGEGGWKSLIPIYGDYVTYKICWAGIAYWIAVVLAVLSTLFSLLAYPFDLFQTVTTPEEVVAILQQPSNMVFLILSLVFSGISLIWQIVKQYKTSKVFGHGFGFFLGLLLFPTIFTLILGFGSSKYVGMEY